jgi:hypothetical protein
VYVQKTAEHPKIPIGDYLGDLTNELQEYGSDSYIDEFVSGGPKNYAFRLSAFQPVSVHINVR